MDSRKQSGPDGGPPRMQTTSVTLQASEQRAFFSVYSPWGELNEIPQSIPTPSPKHPETRGGAPECSASLRSPRGTEQIYSDWIQSDTFVISQGAAGITHETLFFVTKPGKKRSSFGQLTKGQWITPRSVLKEEEYCSSGPVTWPISRIRGVRIRPGVLEDTQNPLRSCSMIKERLFPMVSPGILWKDLLNPCGLHTQSYQHWSLGLYCLADWPLIWHCWLCYLGEVV